ncbi:MAG: HprK-related kinase A [Rhodocyclaceae bacterium]|nr:HprK-related kinase A [Rhodocyclaceae bacterium]
MIVADLSPEELRGRLGGAGLSLRVGAYLFRIHSPLEPVARGLALMYPDYPLAPEGEFADFPVRVMPGRFLRRWLQPQARFLANGHLPFKPMPTCQALPLLEWGLNWCVSNKVFDRLVIHSAVLERKGLALLLPGSPGAGKSTLCAALAYSGWRLLSDELTLADLGVPRVYPLPRPISLKNRSIGILKEYAPGAVCSEPVHDTSKGSVALMRAPADSVARALEPALPRWVVFPRYVAGASSDLRPLSRGIAFMRLAEQGFNYGLLGRAGFDALSDLVDGCDCHEFRYSRLEEAVALLGALDG